MWRAKKEKELHFLSVSREKFMLGLSTSFILLSEKRRWITESCNLPDKGRKEERWIFQV